MQKNIKYTETQLDRIIRMAWEDRTPYYALKYQFNLSPNQLVSLMRKLMKKKSFIRWKKRISARKTKNHRKNYLKIDRFKCSLQRTITLNKISKRN